MGARPILRNDILRLALLIPGWPRNRRCFGRGPGISPTATLWSSDCRGEVSFDYAYHSTSSIPSPWPGAPRQIFLASHGIEIVCM